MRSGFVPDWRWPRTRPNRSSGCVEDYALLAGQLVKENPIHQPLLWTHLMPLSAKLFPDLEKLFANRELPESQQIGAANALAVFAGR